jgi:hypothetical protein
VNDFGSIVELAAPTDAEAAHAVSESTHADLVARITATPCRATGRGSAAERPLVTRRRFAVGLPAVAAVAVAALVITSSVRPGHHAGPANVGPAKAQLLSFTRHGRYLDVIVRNPLADAKKYNAEFKAHGLRIKLSLLPVSPSLVGTLLYFDGSSAIRPITAVGKCFSSGSANPDQCPVGVRVPIDYHGAASLVFGRAARPGERYATTVPATMRGEVLHGLHIAGHRVGAVLAMLRARHVTAEYDLSDVFVLRIRPNWHVYSSMSVPGVLARRVPLNWFVYAAYTWAPGQVVLFVSKTRYHGMEVVVDLPPHRRG